MLIASVVLGLLVPVLSFSIASGAGFSALTNISYAAQSYGMKSGLGFYNLNTGEDTNNEPHSKKVK